MWLCGLARKNDASSGGAVVDNNSPKDTTLASCARDVASVEALSTTSLLRTFCQPSMLRPIIRICASTSVRTQY